MKFYSWQKLPMAAAGKAPYNRFSPNLALVAAEIRRRFDARGGNGFNVRPTRDSDPNDPPLPSTHAFGAAWDGTIVDPVRRAACIDWLLSVVVPARRVRLRRIPPVYMFELLGVQAIHDYAGCRIWRVGRTTSSDPNRWWKTQTPSRASGMGQVSSRWLHIETTPDRWFDTTPIAARFAPSGTTTPPGLVGAVPANVPAPTVSIHSPRSEQVTALQEWLNAHGFDCGRPDGRCGPRTVAAIVRLQRALGVDDDGVYGPLTAAAAGARYYPAGGAR